MGVAELADALDLGSSVNRCAGSSPVARTTLKSPIKSGFFLWLYVNSWGKPEKMNSYITSDSVKQSLVFVFDEKRYVKCDYENA